VVEIINFRGSSFVFMGSLKKNDIKILMESVVDYARKWTAWGKKW
jgi:hypothetical protein